MSMYKDEATRKISANNRLLQQICSKSGSTTLQLCDVNDVSLRPDDEQVVLGQKTYDLNDLGGLTGQDWSAALSGSVGPNSLSTKDNINGDIIYFTSSAFGVTDVTTDTLVAYDRINDSVLYTVALSLGGSSPGVVVDLSYDVSTLTPPVNIGAIVVSATNVVGIAPINKTTGSSVNFSALSFATGPGGAVTLGQIAAGAMGRLRTDVNVGNTLIYVFYANDVFDTGSGNKGGIAEFDNTLNRAYIRTIATDIPVDTAGGNDRVGVQMDYDFDNDYLLLNTGKGSIFEIDLDGNVVNTYTSAPFEDGLVHLPETAYEFESQATPFNRVVEKQTDGSFVTSDYGVTWSPYTVTGVVTDCALTAQNATEYNTISTTTTGVGSIPSGALSYSITNLDGVGPWTFNGTTIPATVSSISDTFAGAGVLGAAIPFDAAGNSLLVIYSI